ncbi:hypothetical protein B0H17DRAFT_1078624 [Mycena rosella]|uniref:Uncharacterized protein n=1 Tax=Mycena rosella TaxID=1033263 RepID=A0AAD7GCL6_MYCRO|nr:hypothetical protein B0H17DRAFT_1078624 [Mycena rosella]
MKLQVALAALFFGAFISANSGIFSDDGGVLSDPAEGAPEARTVKGGLAKKETNFERMRRGLPPLPPARRSSGFKPKPVPSKVPCAPLSSTAGYIKVAKSDGTAAGYISKTFDGKRSYTLTQSTMSALEVKVASSSPFNGPFNLLGLNAPDTHHPYIGAVGGSKGYYFGNGQRGTAYLAGTGTSAANSPPSSKDGSSLKSLGYNAPSESQIWSMDCTTRAISAQWTNSDSTQHSTTIFYDPAVHYLGLTFDLDAFNHRFNEGAYAVTFTFVPL